MMDWNQKLEISRLLRQIEERGLILSLSDGNLKLTGAKGHATNSIIEKIKVNRDEIINIIKGYPSKQFPDCSRDSGISLNSIVQISPPSDVDNLFCIHTVTGSSGCYRGLVPVLKGAYNLIGLNALGYDSDWRVHNSIPEMADIYCQQIKYIQPNGPYHICGYSMGGSIALEVAHKLTDRGNEIRRLYLLDTKFTCPYDTVVSKQLEDHPNWMWKALAHLHLAPDVAAEVRKNGILEDCTYSEIIDFMTQKGREFKPFLYDREDLSQEKITTTILSFFTGMMKARQTHKYKEYHGELYYFMAMSDPEPVNLDLINSLAPNMASVILAPGDHFSLMYNQENLREVGRRMLLVK